MCFDKVHKTKACPAKDVTSPHGMIRYIEAAAGQLLLPSDGGKLWDASVFLQDWMTALVMRDGFSPQMFGGDGIDRVRLGLTSRWMSNHSGGFCASG